MDPIKDKFRYYNSLADKELTKFPQIEKLEQVTGVPKTYLAAGVLGLVTILIVFNFWGELFSNLIGWLYPAYASFKAIESEGKTDDTQWLTYWSVFGFVNIIEFFSDLILHWVPFYYFFKTIFFLWLFLPSSKGAQVLYTKFFRPALLSYEGDIDRGISKAKKAAKNVINPETDSPLNSNKSE